MLTNFCINFLLYCVSGRVFRGELMYLLRCQCKELYKRNDGKKKSYPKTNVHLQQSKTKHQQNKNPSNT